MINSEGKYGLERGLVGWWRLKNSNDGINDIIGMNNGVLYGNAAYATESGRECISLDGIDSYIDIGVVEEFKLSNFTISAWVNWTGSNYSVILSTGYVNAGSYKNTQFLINNADGTLNFVYGNGISASTSVASIGVIANNEWTHCAVTFSSADNIKFYINGVLDLSQTSNGVTYDSTYYRFGIGARIFSGPLSWFIDSYLDGYINHVRLYNRILSDTEIARLARIN